MVDDVELLRRYVENRSEAAFAELVKQRLGLVYSIALRQTSGDVHLAQDVAQLVFEALARKAAHLMRREAIVGWLYRVTHFIAVDAVRKEQRRRRREMKAEVSTGSEPDQAAAAKHLESLRPVLDAAIAGLAAKDRDAILLRFYQGKSFAEVGTALRISEDAVRMRINRALEKLRRQLRGTALAPEATTLSTIIAGQESVGAHVQLGTSVTAAALNASHTPASLPLFLQVMSTAKTSSVFAAITGIAMLGTVGFEFTSWRRAEAELSRQKGVNHSRSLQMQVLERDSRQAEAAAQAIKDQTAAYKQNITVARASTDVGERTAEEDRGRAFLATHPEARAALTAFFRGRIDARYYSLFRKLGLTPAQIESFEQIMLRHQRGSPVWSASTAQGQAILWPLDQSPDTPDGELRSLLGPMDFDAYREFSKSSGPVQGIVEDMAVMAFASGSPLTSDQAEQLQHAITQSTPGPSNGSNTAQTDWGAVTVQSAVTLSPAQMEILSRKIASIKADTIIQRAAAAAKQPGK